MLYIQSKIISVTQQVVILAKNEAERNSNDNNVENGR